MQAAHSVWQVDTFLAVTIGIVVLFLGKRINRLVPVFGRYSIP